MTPYYADDRVTLHHGDALAVVSQLPAGSVDSIVTSPPYFGLRDYGSEGQYGLEATPAEYVETMRALFAEVRRVLAADGTLWLNLGDSYSSRYKGSGGTGKSTLAAQSGMSPEAVLRSQQRQQSPPRRYSPEVPEKNLLGVPWRVAFALQDDGWILRNEVIWAKSNAMPESVTDRLSSRHEHLFMFSKTPSYWFDLDPIREPHADVSLKRAQPHRTPTGKSAREGLPYQGIAPAQTLNLSQMNHPGGRNPGDVWTIPTQPFGEAHFAVMPLALAERSVLAGCKPNGTVLDPFSGSGTTGAAATKHGRRYVGIDLSTEYLDLSLRTRFAQPGLDLTPGGAA